MKEITLILPDQLFENHPAVSKGRIIYLVEEFLFFKVQEFHIQRLVLLRASMRQYEAYLKKQNFEVIYIESSSSNKRGEIFQKLADLKIEIIHLASFEDQYLEEDIHFATVKFSLKLKWYDSPSFFCTRKEIEKHFSKKTHFSMASFYAYQRKKLNLLMEDGGPVGGKFSFDTENRKKLPKKQLIPEISWPKENLFVKEAKLYVAKNFPLSVGSAETFLYPTNFDEAKVSLEEFLKKRLALFGLYEDAIVQKESFLFHSILSPLINIGILTVREVIEKTIVAFEKLSIPLNSAEGFIRQIIGWREFMRAIYFLRASKDRTSNYFNHKNKLPASFWDGSTGIDPIDQTIKRILKTGYCHHIERLMVLGNFFLLLEIDPNEVYKWFMTFFIDAYDWVMVPNIYGMSQYANGGVITTKPYISGSNYIIKMSDYKKGDWSETWDGLFWKFLKKHQALFKNNLRTRMLLTHLEKNQELIEAKINCGQAYMSDLFEVNS